MSSSCVPLRKKRESADARLQHAADDLDSATRELLDLISLVPEAAWNAGQTAEGWPVAAVARHIAKGYLIHMGWLDHLRRGERVPGSPPDLDRQNERDARSMRERAEVISEIERNSTRLAGYFRDLQPREISQAGPHGPLGGDAISVEEMLGICAWHVRSHMESVRAAMSGR